MIVTVQASVPSWDLHLPDCPLELKDREAILKEWVWKYGKDQLLSQLVVSAESAESDTEELEESTECNRADHPTEGEPTQSEEKTKENVPEGTGSIVSDDQEESLHLEFQQRLDLMEKLQTVQQDFLERVQKENGMEDISQEEDEEEETNHNPATLALRELLDSVLEWSHADYGYLAQVEQQTMPNSPKNADAMNDISELDHSEKDKDNQSPTRWVIGRKLAAVNVPYDTHNGEENDLSDSDSDSEDSSVEEARPPQRKSHSITTYGPVHYKNIPGSVTLMMDQLRFEPVNPLDLLHEGSDEDNSDNDEVTASQEYNYLEVYWDRIQKYQLTPKSNTRHHLFKLIFQKPGTTTTHTEVVFKMKSRPDLERIAEDVKTRVTLPSRRSKADKAFQNPKKRRKKKQRTKIQQSSSSVAAMSSRERLQQMPPSLPKRMTSEQNLSQQMYPLPHHVHAEAAKSNDSPAPVKPIRRPSTLDAAVTTTDLIFVDDDDNDSYYTDESSSDSEEDDGGRGDLYAIQNLLANCRQPIPLTYKARERDKRPTTQVLEDSNHNNTPPLALLPEKWQRLVVLPIFESRNNEQMQAIMVLATTEPPAGNHHQPTLIEFGSKKSLDWWVPSVITAVQDLFQHKQRLEELSTHSKTVQELNRKLKDALQKHSDMIHGILPPMAVAKLKVQPQEWKSPLQQFYQQPLKVPMPAGPVSVDDSSISGSIHSRYGLLVGGVPSLDSSSTILTSARGAGDTPSESEYGLTTVSENLADHHAADAGNNNNLPERSSSTKTAQQQAFGRPVPQRTNSVGNINAAIRGLQRQGSVTNRAGTTRPIFSRMDSKRGMMMMRASSARGGALMRMDSAKRGNLIKMDSGRFGSRGIPRLNSLRSLHGGGGMSVATSLGGNTSVDTFDQSFRTMYTDDESIHPEDLSEDNGIKGLSALSQDVSYLTSQSSVRYINSTLVGGMKSVQALYAGEKTNVSIIVISIAGFYEFASKLKVESTMDVLAKLLFTVDRLCEKHRVIRVEAIGNTIVVMSGLFTADNEANNGRMAAIAALEMAKEVVSEAQTITIPKEATKDDNGRRRSATETMRIRAGIHAGKVNYGVLGQNVPQLNCFGDDIVLALRMEQTAPDNCIRVSKGFHDLVGNAEKEWEQEVERVQVFCSPSNGARAKAATAAILSSTSPTLSAEQAGSSGSTAAALSIETYTLEPPPPAIYSDTYASSSSFSTIAAFGSSDFLQISDHGLLGIPLEESFVSGEFDVD